MSERLQRLREAAAEGKRVQKWRKGGLAARRESERLSAIDPHVKPLGDPAKRANNG
jgi:hypothetical protein